MSLTRGSVKRLERFLEKQSATARPELTITHEEFSQILDSYVVSGDREVKKINEKTFVIPKGFCGNGDEIIFEI